MYPYLHNKDQLMMDKLSYRIHDPERFDIVVFPVVRDGKEEYYIKRVIGLPGETVQIIDGYVYINGEKLDENYGAEVMSTSCWEITATEAMTAAMRMSKISKEKRLSVVPGCVSGRLIVSA